MNRIVRIFAIGASALALVSAAQAADLIIQEPMMPGIVESGGGNWDGVYLGVFGGYAWGVASGPDYDLDGWLAGAAIGANFTLTDGIVAGVVGDIAWSEIDDGIVDTSVDWVGSVRGRLGIDAGVFMPYVTGGLAFASVSYDPSSITNTHIGWTAGAGVEFAATEELSIDLLYRYSDYGEQDVGAYDLGITTHQVTAGVNWRF